MDDSSASDATPTPLTALGVDFQDAAQASEFLEMLLDDATLQVTANAYARYFWYGVVVVIFLFAVQNLVARWVGRSRYGLRHVFGSSRR